MAAIEIARRRHRDEIGPAAQRHEALAAQRMALEHLQHQLGERPGAEQADHADAAAVRDVDLGEPVVADRVALVDVQLHGIVAGLDHAAERREGLGGQRLGREFAHRSSLVPHLQACARRSSVSS